MVKGNLPSCVPTAGLVPVVDLFAERSLAPACRTSMEDVVPAGGSTSCMCCGGGDNKSLHLYLHGYECWFVYKMRDQLPLTARS